ncbi:hypothetical protein SAMN05421823_11724 [Catalinimonas alkaloidigena]|uniref:Tetratricopeptide repeat-containing protein n=1 Tax=Catalinimonas alkaloidigena TaxID=1075417 RepID=A0A1G9UNE0_9BACT|nr:hypothetical protein [Catalinimonas alkaloidigena]SDM61440.1 hypothetical protein SAMN05421823_11724 [Catalinimonas alkaloidigena]
MSVKTFLFLCSLGLALLALSLPKTPETPLSSAPRLDIGTHQTPITTTSKAAQRFFDQGLVLTYGFNHREAIRSYREALKHDSTCAMAYWGIGYALGPNINAAMDDADVAEAYAAVQQAQRYQAHVQPWERAMIRALAQRYAPEPQADRAALDRAYADAMATAYRQFSDHADVASVYAESLMDLHPWDFWHADGTPQPWTPHLLEVLEHVLAQAPDHPQANHLYIHATEASPHPERAMASAQRLATLVPSSGHLVHMPSHTYIRTGDYHLGSVTNEAAAQVDSAYLAACNAQGIYPLAYYPHNYHFLVATATLEGRGRTALEAALHVAEHADLELMTDPGWATLQHYYAIPYYTLVKFAQWDAILHLTAPGRNLVYPNLIWHYARGMALAGKQRLDEARAELAKVRQLAHDSTMQKMTIWDINRVADLTGIAERVLEADVLQRQGHDVQAIALLREAVALEDALAYNEPPDWFFSVRHHLGPVLLKSGRYAEAEQVYREDLRTYPKNGWALNGLLRSLQQQEKQAEAQTVKVQLQQAWQWADVTLVDSRLLEPVPRLLADARLDSVMCQPWR